MHGLRNIDKSSLIEDAIRKAFAEFGECSEVRPASDFRGPLDIKNVVLGYLMSLRHRDVVLRWDFTMSSLPREMRFESSRTTQTAVDLLEPRETEGCGGYAFAIAAAVIGPLEVEILQIRSFRLQLLRCKEARAPTCSIL